ncbi:MAG: RHS repeat domain-containing protein [Syntrophales bacterium]
MSSRLRKGLFASIAIITLLFTSVILSYSESINYVYDDLNRLIRIEYGSEQFIEYTYDEVGNRTQKTIGHGDSPTATLSQSPSSTVSGQAFTLTWGSTYADTCAIDKSFNGGAWEEVTG